MGLPAFLSEPDEEADEDSIYLKAANFLNYWESF
jgi:hypothetical protein